MLITGMHITDNGLPQSLWGEIGTKKLYAYKRHMLISGMLITGIQCIPSLAQFPSRAIGADLRNPLSVSWLCPPVRSRELKLSIKLSTTFSNEKKKKKKFFFYFYHLNYFFTSYCFGNKIINM